VWCNFVLIGENTLFFFILETDVFNNFPGTVIECAIFDNERRKKTADGIWLEPSMLFLFVTTELCFDPLEQSLCVGSKLAINLSHYHSNGHCNATLRGSWSVSAKDRSLLCCTITGQMMYFLAYGEKHPQTNF